MKKIIALLLACVMVLGLFAASGETPAGNEGGNETTGNVEGNETTGNSGETEVTDVTLKV